MKENIKYHVIYKWKKFIQALHSEKHPTTCSSKYGTDTQSQINDISSQQPLPRNSTFSFELWVACVSVHSEHSIWEASDKTLAPLLGDRMGNAHDTWTIQRKWHGHFAMEPSLILRRLNNLGK